MGLNENERNSQETLRNAADLFVALHECYQLFSAIPLVFEVEIVLKKLEEEGNGDDPIKLLEYFRLPTIKYPLLDLLKIEKSTVSPDELIENVTKIIHKADNFIAKNIHAFFINDNETFFNEIISRLETADMVFNNFNEKIPENFSMLKRLKPIEMHDLYENSELLQKLHAAILPGDEMKF
uniref:Uncharacterized protein n=1 Tax=Meloidogyne javanica TaxID=6303 RepID=A0A915LVW1_MELJA